jgi:hypothetical protein
MFELTMLESLIKTIFEHNCNSIERLFTASNTKEFQRNPQKDDPTIDRL